VLLYVVVECSAQAKKMQISRLLSSTVTSFHVFLEQDRVLKAFIQCCIIFAFDARFQEELGLRLLAHDFLPSPHFVILLTLPSSLTAFILHSLQRYHLWTCRKA
jgi:hypothetical protein